MTSSPAPAPTSLLRRVLEWFWRGDAARAALSSDRARSATFFCEQRARIAEEVGRQALEPAAPWRAGDASHLACALFVESIGWSLRLAATQGSASSSARPPERAELLDLSSARREGLLEAAGDEAALARVLDHVLDRRFETGASSEAERTLAARELAGVASALLRGPWAVRSAFESVMLQRVARVALAALLGVLLVAGAFVLRSRLDARADLSRDKAWTASSQYDAGCVSPRRRCEGDKPYFFHTQEEVDPWLQFDLVEPQQISKVRAVNRQDCCGERAVPLLIELSLDGERWREVARIDHAFEVWTAKFAPARARYVRLRAPRRTILHLEQVRVFG